MADWHLFAAFLLTIAVLLIADYLAQRWLARRARRRRLEARIAELGRDARQRQERPTLNTRSKAP
jgi:hypothetical protein